MPSVNPGPAVTSNPNTMLAASAVNSLFQITSGTPGAFTSALRLLAVARSSPILGLGDIAVVPVINTTQFSVSTIVFSNALTATGASASAAALTVSLNGGPAVTGQSFVASAALATLTGQAKAVSASVVATATFPNMVLTSTMGASGGASNFLYLNATVVSAAAATMDMFVYGYDLS
jgi:hypothetical protein